MRTRTVRIGLISLALVALLGLVLVACHKKEGSEQSQAAIAPAALVAQVVPVAQPEVAAKPAPAAVAPVAAPAVARVTPSPRPQPRATEGVRRVASSAGSIALPVNNLPPGEEPLPVEGDAATVQYGPVEPLSVVVSELPPADPVAPEVIHRVRAKKEPFIRTTDPTLDTDQFVQDASAPDTAPSSLLGAGDTRAQIDPGSPSVSQTIFDNSTTGGVPFDVDMAVGPSHIVTDINTQFSVYNKLGTRLTGPTSYRTFWSGLTNCGAAETATNFLADPQISYDDQNDRWVMLTLRAQVSSGGLPVSSQLCLACSQTADPTGAWWKYEINDGAGLADYPHIGIGQDAIFVGTNHFGTGGSFDNASVTAIQKTAAYAGTTITPTKKNAGASYFTPQPAERRGFAQGHYPPSGTPHYFVIENNTAAAEVWRWTYPTFDAGATFTSWGTLQASGGTPPDITGSTITTAAIDGDDERIMDAELRWPYLWYTRGGAAPTAGLGSIMWAGANVSGGSPVVYQSGEYASTTMGFWWSDCTVDKNQNFAVGFTGANNATGTFPSALITGREEAITANNTLEAYRVSKAGEVKYNSWEATTSSWRWGDYAGVAVDPNGCDIWFHGEYTYPNASTPLRRTWLRNFKFPSCVAGATRQAFLDKSWYYCVDAVNASIIDTAGTPTNAVFHCSSGTTIAATISGTGPTYTVSATNTADLNAVQGDTIYLSFTGSDAASYNSGTASVDCTSQVCVYLIDPITGGCDNDSHLDQGETLNINVALANYEAYNLPGPIQAELQLVGSDPNVTIVNGTAYYPALESMTYAYSTVPFSVRYTGAFPANCIVPLQFQVVNIQAVDGGWDSAGCTAGTNLVSARANTDDNPLAAILSESFDGTTYPPTGWSQVQVAGTGLTARVTAGTLPTCAPHSGVGMVKFDTYNYAAGTAARLVAPSLNLSTYGSATGSFWMYHSGTYTNADTIDLQASDNGTTWTTLATATRNNPSTLAWLQTSGSMVNFCGTGHTTVRTGFLFTSAYGLNVYFDDAAVAPVSLVCETTTCAGAPVLAYDQFAFVDTGCNDNGYLDPGEVGELTLYLANTGNEWAYGTTATLSCPTCPAGWGSICDNTATYGDVPYGTTYVYGAATDTFSVAVNSSLACGTVLPFVITANATNPYGPATIAADVQVGGPLVYVPSAGGHTWEEHFTVDPGTAGATGRYGFTTAWTESTAARTTLATVTSACAETDADNAGCAVDNVASITHTFSTVGIDYDIDIFWEWDAARQPTNGGLYLDYSVDGTNFTRLVSTAGANTTTADWECWGGSLYASVDPTEQCYGTGCVLGNPNLAIRLGSLGSVGSRTPDGYFDNFRMDGYSIQCTTNACTGVCPSVPTNPPPVPDNGAVPGTPFRLVRNGSNVDMTWDVATCTASNYRVLWGNITSLSLVSGVTNGTVTSASCGLGNTGSATNQTSPTPTAGQCFFAVIDAVEGTEFGRHGNNSAGNERLLTGDTTLCPGVTTKNTTATACTTGFAAAAPSLGVQVSPVQRPANQGPRQPIRQLCGSGTEPVKGEAPQTKGQPIR